MRSKLNLRGSTAQHIAEKLPAHLTPMPMEWLDAGSWRLPSGKALAEFALQAGFLAPLLLKPDRIHRLSPVQKPPRRIESETFPSGKHLEKGADS